MTEISLGTDEAPTEAEDGHRWIERILADVRAETGLPLLDVAVRQTGGDASDGLLRDWPEPASGAETNYGYAFQWWALAALTAFLYVWFQFIAPRRKPPPA